MTPEEECFLLSRIAANSRRDIVEKPVEIPGPDILALLRTALFYNRQLLLDLLLDIRRTVRILFSMGPRGRCGDMRGGELSN